MATVVHIAPPSCNPNLPDREPGDVRVEPVSDADRCQGFRVSTLQQVQTPPMPALPASADGAGHLEKESIEVVMAPRSGAGLRSTMEAGGIEPPSVSRPERASTSLGCP